MSEQNVQEEVVVSVDALKAELTNKNEQYIYQLERALKEAGFDEAQIEKELSVMLPEIVEKQKSGRDCSSIVRYGNRTRSINRSWANKRPRRKITRLANRR